MIRLEEGEAEGTVCLQEAKRPPLNPLRRQNKGRDDTQKLAQERIRAMQLRPPPISGLRNSLRLETRLIWD